MDMPFLDQHGDSKFYEVRIGNLWLWFSYATLIAFGSHRGLGWVTENMWGPTTGKHINEIIRNFPCTQLSRPEFERRFSDLIGPRLEHIKF